MTLGRPSYIHEENYNVSMLSISDFDGWDAPPEGGNHVHEAKAIGAEGFIAMARLSVILANLLKQLYTIKAVEFLRDKSADFILSVATPIATSLTGWRTTFLEPLLKRTSFPNVTGESQASEIVLQNHLPTHLKGAWS